MPIAFKPIPELTEKEKIRFWSRVNKVGKIVSTELGHCWEWTGTKSSSGYGDFGAQFVRTATHRISWTLHNGRITDGLLVLHRCDNPPCVNPAHLFLGTVGDNNSDMDQKGRRVIYRGEKHWSKLKPELIPRGDDHHARKRPERMARGINNGSAKLTNESVAEMRKLRELGTSFRKLGGMFGVSSVAATNAVKGKTWAHVK